MSTIIKNVCITFGLCMLSISLHGSDYDKKKAILARQATQKIEVIQERENVETLFKVVRDQIKESLPHLLELEQVKSEKAPQKKSVTKSSITTGDIIRFQEKHPSFNNNFAVVILHSAEPRRLKQKVEEQRVKRSACPIRTSTIDTFEKKHGLERNTATVVLHSARKTL